MLNKDRLPCIGQRHREMEDQKPWPGFSRIQDFWEGGGLEPIVKMSEFRNTLSKPV